MKNNSDFGIIGLGVMGSNLSLNLSDNKVHHSVYNRSTGAEARVVEEYLTKLEAPNIIQGYTNLGDFVRSINKPRKILIMIKAGNAIDNIIDELLPFLENDDILIDGGNSFYKDTEARIEKLNRHKIHFFGCGISGGAKGARFGPSLMPSGPQIAYKYISTVLDTISAKDTKGNPCCSYLGQGGCGHYVKMVHNGIEYAEMQLLAELYALLSTKLSNEAIADIFEKWNKGDLESYLLGITIEILRTKDEQGHLLDKILDKSKNKGTGYWSVRSSLELGIPSTMMSSALFARFLSSFKNKRSKLSKSSQSVAGDNSVLNLKSIRNAYRFSRLINHHQGFDLIAEASRANKWELNLSEIARIWTNGCIIRSSLMEELAVDYQSYRSIFNNELKLETLHKLESDVTRLILMGMKYRIAVDNFYSAYNYFISMTTEKLPANLIQAQRDFFGGHSFERIDRPKGESYSHKWGGDA